MATKSKTRFLFSMWGVLYFIASFAQVLAIVDTIPNYIDVSTGLQLLIAFIIAEIPIIGSVAGIYGSVVNWDLTVAVGLALFVWPIVILLVYLFRYPRSDSDSATKENHPSVEPRSADAAISPWMANVLREQVEREDAAIATPPTDTETGVPRQPGNPESRVESPPPPQNRNRASRDVTNSMRADPDTINTPVSVDAGSDVESTTSATTAPDVEPKPPLPSVPSPEEGVSHESAQTERLPGSTEQLMGTRPSSEPPVSAQTDTGTELSRTQDSIAKQETAAAAVPSAEPSGAPDASAAQNASATPDTSVGQEASSALPTDAGPEATSSVPGAARESDSAPDRGPEVSSGAQSWFDRLRDQIVVCREQIVKLSGAADNPALLRSINREVPELFASIALVSNSGAAESDFVERLLRPVSDNDEYSNEELLHRLRDRVRVYGPDLLDPEGNAGYLFARRIGRVGDGVLIRMVNDSVSDSRASLAAE